MFAHRLFSQIDLLPIAQQLGDGHGMSISVSHPAGVDQVSHSWSILQARRVDREAVGRRRNVVVHSLLYCEGSPTEDWLRRFAGKVVAKLLHCAMADIPARELRNHVSDVLRRVEAGERLRVTVSGRPVAELAPLARKPRSMRWEEFMRDSEQWRADVGLIADLRRLLPDTTDDDEIE